MFPLQNTGLVSVITPTSTATTATSTGNIDTLGYESVLVAVHLNSQAATSSNPPTSQGLLVTQRMDLPSRLYQHRLVRLSR